MDEEVKEAEKNLRMAKIVFDTYEAQIEREKERIRREEQKPALESFREKHSD
jgi:hypothetical protein